MWLSHWQRPRTKMTLSWYSQATVIVVIADKTEDHQRIIGWDQIKSDMRNAYMINTYWTQKCHNALWGYMHIHTLKGEMSEYDMCFRNIALMQTPVLHVYWYSYTDPSSVVLLYNCYWQTYSVVCGGPRRLLRWKAGNVLFNDAFNTFYLRIYGVRHMIQDHSAREETLCRYMDYSFRLTARFFFICIIPQTG